MAIHVLRDPRPYLLAVIAVALTIIVPLLFVFVTMMDRVFGPEASAGWIVLWMLLGVVLVGGVIELMVLLGRATRLSEHEHEMQQPRRESPALSTTIDRSYSLRVTAGYNPAAMTRTRRRFLEQVVGGAALAAAAPSLAYADSSAQAPSASARHRPLRLPGPHAGLPRLGRRAARPDREVDRDVPARVARARAHHGERREDRMGTDRAVRSRHLRRGPASADRAAGHRPRHQRDRRDQRRGDRRAVEVPLVVPLPRAGGRRHRALGSLRADHRQARGGPARRIRAAAAGVRIEHAPRHQSRRRGGAARAAPRPVRLQGVQDPARHARWPQSRRRARTERSHHSGGAQGGRTGHRAPCRREQLLHARRRDPDGTPARGLPTTPRSRSRARTGSSSGRRK